MEDLMGVSEVLISCVERAQRVLKLPNDGADCLQTQHISIIFRIVFILKAKNICNKNSFECYSCFNSNP
jgi:hypothetical protein